MQNKTDNLVYAGFFVRMAAYIVDLLIVGTVLLIVKLPIWITTLRYPNNMIVRDFIFEYSIADILYYLLKVIYFILLTYFTGSTLGKKLFHIKVISCENRNMTFFEVAFRETVGRFLSALIIYVGYMMAGLDNKKRGLHDILSDTNVIYYHEKRVHFNTPINYKNMEQMQQNTMRVQQMDSFAEAQNDINIEQ